MSGVSTITVRVTPHNVLARSSSNCDVSVVRAGTTKRPGRAMRSCGFTADHLVGLGRLSYNRMDYG